MNITGFGGHSLSDDVTEGSLEVTESPTVLSRLVLVPGTGECMHSYIKTTQNTGRYTMSATMHDLHTRPENTCMRD